MGLSYVKPPAPEIAEKNRLKIPLESTAMGKDVCLCLLTNAVDWRGVSAQSLGLVGLNPLIQEFLAPLIEAVADIQVVVHEIVALGAQGTQIAGVVRTSRASR